MTCTHARLCGDCFSAEAYGEVEAQARSLAARVAELERIAELAERFLAEPIAGPTTAELDRALTMRHHRDADSVGILESRQAGMSFAAARAAGEVGKTSGAAGDAGPTTTAKPDCDTTPARGPEEAGPLGGVSRPQAAEPRPSDPWAEVQARADAIVAAAAPRLAALEALSAAEPRPPEAGLHREVCAACGAPRPYLLNVDGKLLPCCEGNPACEAKIRGHRTDKARQPTPALPIVERGLRFLLSRIGSWTNARFDQHLRYEFGDDQADEVMAWLAEHVSPFLGKGPNGEPAYMLHGEERERFLTATRSRSANAKTSDGGDGGNAHTPGRRGATAAASLTDRARSEESVPFGDAEPGHGGHTCEAEPVASIDDVTYDLRCKACLAMWIAFNGPMLPVVPRAETAIPQGMAMVRDSAPCIDCKRPTQFVSLRMRGWFPLCPSGCNDTDEKGGSE